LHHHERWDGTGYPKGLKGEEIPLGARIFAVVDVWDALTSDRPYRASWEGEQVLEHLRAASGSQFDPEVVEHFIEMIKEEEGEPSSEHSPRDAV
jgi:HD-GYP domain-containing protein (c-di-GMP phosphodiesterase class II)